jgi:hypothetical protein
VGCVSLMKVVIAPWRMEDRDTLGVREIIAWLKEAFLERYDKQLVVEIAESHWGTND